jgi:hypothetical protein
MTVGFMQEALAKRQISEFEPEATHELFPRNLEQSGDVILPATTNVSSGSTRDCSAPPPDTDQDSRNGEEVLVAVSLPRLREAPPQVPVSRTAMPMIAGIISRS